MKQKTFLIMLTFFTLLLAGCQEKASKKSSSNSSGNPATSCTGNAYWITPGCQGFCQYNPTNSACSGSANNCSGQAYWTTPGCAGYCQQNPSASGCGGTNPGGTTGTSNGGTTGTGACAINPTAPYCSPTYCSITPKPYGCLSNGTNCYINQTAPGCGGSSTTVPRNPYWGMWYPPANVAPAGSCSPTYVPNGLASALETRKGTITIAGAGRNSADPETEYSPFHPHAPNYLNTSSMLKSVGQAKMFFLTDSILKLRVKVLPEPESHGATGVCYNRGSGSYVPGYTKLQYYVTVYGTSSNNAVTYLGQRGPFTTSVNNCSDAIDLSEFKEASPTGLIVTINQVKENKNCSNQSYWDANGWAGCSLFNKVRSMECWSMEFEVAADGTKTFD